VAAAARPNKAVEMANLPEQLARLAGPARGKGRADRTVHAIAAQQNEIANFTILNSLVQLLHRPAVPGHQADPHFQILRSSFFRQLKHFPRAWAIGSQRLFHENVDALLDSVSEMDPAESQW